MFCMKCGKQLPDNAKFCFVCGTALENVTVQPESDKLDLSDIFENDSDTEGMKQRIAELDRQYNDKKLKELKEFKVKVILVMVIILLIIVLICGTVGLNIFKHFSGSNKNQHSASVTDKPSISDTDKSSDTSQQADPSAKFVGTAKLDDIDFSIEVSSENICDKVAITFRNGYEKSVRISANSGSGFAFVTLIDTAGTQYKTAIDWETLFMDNMLGTDINSFGNISVGKQFTATVEFEGLPSGTIAESINIDYIDSRSVKIENTIPEAEQKRAEEASKENSRKQSLAFSGTTEKDNFTVNVESTDLSEGISINLKAGANGSGVMIGNSSKEALEVILKDIEGNEYNSEYSWKEINKPLSDTEEFQGLLPKNSEYTITVKFENIPEIIAESITIKDVLSPSFGYSPVNITVKNDNAPVSEKSSAEPVESTVSQTETSQKPSDSSKTESKTSSTEQPVKSSSGFKGSTKIERLSFTIDADSDNIYDGITLHMKNEDSGDVYVMTNWKSVNRNMDVILTDKNGNNYTSNVEWSNTVSYDGTQYENNSITFGCFEPGNEYQVKVIFKDLPEGTKAKTITVKYIGTPSDFLDTSWDPYLDKVTAAVIQNNN